MDDVQKEIAEQLVQIEESFLYLGVLKKTPLMEAMSLYDDKFEMILALSNKVWGEKAPYPEREDLFAAVGETYEQIASLLHANDALNPIYDGIKNIYGYFESLRDAGMGREEAVARVAEINNNRK